jgi:hypothetical protein
MRRVIVRYTVKPGRAEENAELVREVYAELERTKPHEFRYATFQLEDGLTFVHIAEHGTGIGANPLTSLEAFKRFQAGIADRCDEGPVASEAQEVGSYRFRD